MRTVGLVHRTYADVPILSDFLSLLLLKKIKITVIVIIIASSTTIPPIAPPTATASVSLFEGPLLLDGGVGNGVDIAVMVDVAIMVTG